MRFLASDSSFPLKDVIELVLENASVHTRLLPQLQAFMSRIGEVADEENTQTALPTLLQGLSSPSADVRYLCLLYLEVQFWETIAEFYYVFRALKHGRTI